MKREPRIPNPHLFITLSLEDNEKITRNIEAIIGEIHRLEQLLVNASCSHEKELQGREW
jgi:hypothetical protein